jgi:preprotein translocase subunit SecE
MHTVAKTKASAAPTTAKEPHPIVRYIQETRAELRKVTWPTREEVKNLTLIIVIVTVSMALFLGLLEITFQQIIGGVILGQLGWMIAAAVLFIGGVAAFYFNSRQE